MITFRFASCCLAESKALSLAFFIASEQPFSKELEEVSRRYFPALEAYLKQVDFSGQQGKVAPIAISVNGQPKTIFCVGLGKINKHNKIDIEQFRRACGSLVRAMQSRKIDACSLDLPAATLFGQSDYYVAEQMVISASMAAYRFDDFISDQKNKVRKELSIDCCVSAHANRQELEDGIAHGSIIAQAINKVRHWVDTPPSRLTPAMLAGYAQDVANEFGLKATVFGEKEIVAMGMGGLGAVSAGSHEDCKLAILEYRTAKNDAPTIAFVGKGITFDSGGLSIKPATAMETMKDDMAGAAAVIGAMQVLAQFKPDVNIIALMPTSENLPSGTATKPGDVIRFYNGKTAEVKNTDAEGRLILADALAYAVKHYKPDAMIDIATLTGACSYALGPFFTGLMTQHDDMAQRIEKAAQLTGDRVWRLPMDNDFKAAVRADVADLCNSGNAKYRAGAITAAFFLQAFVDETPWAHLDIAGSAFAVPDISYYDTGATGAGMRLLVALAMNWTKTK
ncbi:MAG: Cytosol aminopeptidase [Candidatus Dependentiae bacterium ADurb.Bin331]|nr:MAG: Cytosol aminopeptidase [Candidatus Dependentiae bacterium ADurb.Bin331]